MINYIFYPMGMKNSGFICISNTFLMDFQSSGFSIQRLNPEFLSTNQAPTISACFTDSHMMNITGLFVYYFYERIWNRISWGKILVNPDKNGEHHV